ncbi:response regulator transcription factor [Catenovulum sp. SM1970]|uniref:response regulator transcription factor n=1 Tax=Marinifaba aquimaris TaxID=2741323 RepID=UPI001572A0AC|nr:response regulator transcription factor [Marinifaba aquimaris]NTS76308.1 response regulator transcription factor [Marinifaba aquimaris]
MEKQILLFSPNRISAKSVFAMLTDCQYQVSLIQDELLLLSLVAERRNTAIIIDCVGDTTQSFELLKNIRQKTNKPVAVLSECQNWLTRTIAYELGVDDFIEKPLQEREFIARLSTMLRRVSLAFEQNDSQKVLHINGIKLDPCARKVFCNGQPVALTSMEFNVLHMLMLSPGSVVSKQDLSTKALHYDKAETTRGVDMHICNIRKKFANICDCDKLQNIRGVGYLFLLSEARHVNFSFIE